MIPGSATPFLLAKSDDGFKIERSLRFDRPASSYLNRAFSSAGNRKTFTVSFWTKRTSIGNAQNIFNTSSTPGQTNSSSPRTEFRFNGTGSIKFAVNSSGSSWKALDTTTVFRDFSAWYHVVLSVDTTQTTAANRVKLYVNGVQQALTGTYPDLNEELPYNNNYTHTIGNYANNYNDYFDGYLANFHFIDGQTLAPTDFGEYDAKNIWQPKKFNGSFGFTSISTATGALPIHNTSGTFGGTKVSGNRTDPNASNLVLAISGSGSYQDISATIKGSGTNKTVTANGNVTTSSSEGKYYSGGSLRLTGSSGDYFSIPNSSDFAFGTGDFTVEFWIKTTDTAFNILDITDSGGWSTVVVNNNAPLFWQTSRANTNLFAINTNNDLIDGAWHHVAFVRSSNVVKPYLDGVQIGDSAGYTDNTDYTVTTGSLNIGTGANGVLDGYMQDIRIYKGVAKYTSNFTITKPSNSFHLDFSDNSTDAALGTDSSGLNNTWTVNNISAIDSDGAIYAEFSGSSNQYLRNNSGNVLPGSNGAFTIECHFYPHTTNVIGLFDGGSGSTSIIRNYGNNNIQKQGTTGVNFAGDYTQNAWNHIAVVYTGSTDTDRLYVYVNGVESGYVSGLNGFTPGSTFDIGTINNGGDGRFDGYIRNFRVTHAVVYSSAFTAPSHTDNLSALTDTKLLVLTTPANGLTGAGSGTTLGMSNNGSVTSGTLIPVSESDCLIDTPTDYETVSGNNAGNYCTLNPLKNAQTLSNGNLDVVGGSSWQRSVGTIGMYSGKYYWEYKVTASNEHIIGVGPPDMQLSGNLGAGSPPGSGYGTELGQVNGTGANGSWSNTGASGAGDIIGIAFDADNGNMYVYKNGTALNSGTASHTGLIMPQVPVVSLNGSSRSGTINFGQRPFVYTPPTGYKSLCTTNLPEPTIADGSTAMDVVTYTGNGTSQTISGLNLASSPDFIWIKSRNGSNKYHTIADSVRGIGSNGAYLRLFANTTSAEADDGYDITAITSDGFSLTNGSYSNASSETYVGWAWDAGTSNTTVAVDANGSGLPGAACEYRANPSTGFSIVKVANPTSTQTRVHGLNKKPDLIICKSTASADSWHTYHSSLGYTNYINLNSSGGATSSDQFGSQEPTSTYFYVKANTGSGANKSGGMIYYIWTGVEGYSDFGSYTGNGNSDGPFVHTGFKPAFVLLKLATGGSAKWFIFDSTRDTNNATTASLNTTVDTESSSHPIDFLSNGFKLREADSAGYTNYSGSSYIYAAFAEHPFKFARAR